MEFKITERIVQTTDGSRELRYFTSINHQNHISKDRFVEQLSEQYGIPKFWVNVVLGGAQEMIAQHILDGDVVEVPRLGIFKLLARAKTAKTPDMAGEQSVSRIRVNFLPCKELTKGIPKIDENPQNPTANE